MSIKKYFFLVLLTACSDPKYQSTVNYESRGGFTVAETVNSFGNIPPYSFAVKKKSDDLRDMTFLISAVSRYSNPDIVFDMNKARLEFSGENFPPVIKSYIKMNGVVDPQNGRTTFKEIEVSFIYPSNLNWGEKFVSTVNKNPSENYQKYGADFKIIIPAALNDKTKDIEFVYYRRDISGENMIPKIFNF